MLLVYYPLVMTNIANWKITIFNGKIHDFDWAIFNSYVSLPEGSTKVGLVSIFSLFLVRNPQARMSLHFLGELLYEAVACNNNATGNNTGKEWHVSDCHKLHKM